MAVRLDKLFIGAHPKSLWLESVERFWLQNAHLHVIHQLFGEVEGSSLLGSGSKLALLHYVVLRVTRVALAGMAA